MSNLGIIDADPSEPPNNRDVVQLANRLLDEFNIPTTIEDVGDICAALFVLLYENLFSDRLSGIIRHPVSKEDEIHNCQTVINVLSTDIVRDSLSHIRGVDIVDGDITAISNLLDIFSYLLEYVANKIESDTLTDIEDGKSVTEQDSFVRDTRAVRSDAQSSEINRYIRGSYENETGARERQSPQLNNNENNSSNQLRERLKVVIPSQRDSHLSLSADILDAPPSPIRGDMSQSLMGQKTVDSTELASQYSKDEMLNGNRSPSSPKLGWEEKINVCDMLEDKVDDAASCAVIGGLAASNVADKTKPAMTSTDPTNSGMSASMPPTRQKDHKEEDRCLASTIGAIPTHSSHKSADTKTDRYAENARSASDSYNDLRHLVERTAAMTRVALHNSPILGRFERHLTHDRTESEAARPTIPSDTARLAKELNAEGMRRGEAASSQPKIPKKVAFTSFADKKSERQRLPLEELSDNEFIGRLEDDDWRRKEKVTKTSSKTGHGRESVDKSIRQSDKFAKYLARNRQAELGAAHFKLKTEDRAIRRKQDFLERLYQEDLGEFEEDLQALLSTDHRASADKEKEMLRAYRESKPVIKTVKVKNPSSKKSKHVTRVVNNKAKQSQPVSESTKTTTIQSEEDILPFLLEEFPHLHLSDHTWHELCRKGLYQIGAITRAYKESQRKKSQAQLQLEEAVQRQELLSNMMRKELEHTKRLRELKEQKTKQIQIKNKTHDRRVQSARARRYYNEYQVRARSKQLKRRTREEMVFRDLFKDAMSMQKERIKDIRQYSTDQRKRQEVRRQNEMDSLENFYLDQFRLLAEKLAQERKDACLREKSQQQMVEKVKQELRKKIESEIRVYQEEMFRDDDDAHFRQMDAGRVKRQLHTACYAAKI